MTASAPIAAVTGASGYLGARICDTLEAQGWQVMRLVRSPSTGHVGQREYDLAAPISREVTDLLHSTDVLVHAAYDLALTTRADIWRVNVQGTRRLLNIAADVGIRRTLVLSSMSAFNGTTQLYGRAKLDIEALTHSSGGCAIRPGLVWGERPGGMSAALRRLTRLPVVPVIAGGARLYTVHETDLMMTVGALAAVEVLPSNPISVAHPRPVSIRDLLSTLASQERRPCRFVPVPWQLVYALLRIAEFLHLRVPFRADSLLGLVRSAPGLVNSGSVARLGVALRPFASRSDEPRVGAR